MVKILVSYFLMYPRHLIICGIKVYCSNYVSLELLAHSMTGYSIILLVGHKRL